jgi:3'-phosphoadenosine 5'-phosphosulfate sulfotransferase (PAPS reductase)/FAD synthetase
LIHHVLSVSYGNDSVALLQWAKDANLDLFGRVTAAYCDTGWAKPDWAARVIAGENFARSLGFDVVRINSMGMAELVRMKKGWPGNGQQFCTIHLKGVPFLNWIDEIDPDYEAVVCIGKRREESEARKDTPEYIESSEFHGGRRVWHPLFMHDERMRNELLQRAGFEVLPHRSEECNPCVNANRGDINRLSADEMAKVNRLEVEIGKPMFRPKRFNGLGIYGVVMWARHGKNHEADLGEDQGCGAPFGCGL